MPNPVETIVAKVTGKIAGVEARRRGLKGVFALLAEQHSEVGALLARAEQAEDLTARAGLWSQSRKELLSHDRAEQLALYPVFEEHPELREIVAAHARHAGILEELIRQVDTTGVQSDEWHPKLVRLIAAVTEHADLEEGEDFPRAQALLGDEASEHLAEPFLTAKAQVQSQLA